MARRSSSRVTTVPPTALTSGAKILDFIPLPFSLFLVFRTIVFWVKHWYVFGLLVLYFFIGWQGFLVFMLLFPTAFLGYVWLNNRGYPFTAIIKATIRITYGRRLWKRTVEAAGLNNGPIRPMLFTLKRPPKLGNHHGTTIIYTLNLARTGKTVSDLENVQEYLVAGMQARRSRVRRLTPGVAQLTLEWDPSRNRAMARVTRSATIDPNETQLPTVHLDEDTELEMDTSVLVVGESGSGKSNLTWNLLNSLNATGIPYRMHVIDPKQVELAQLEHSPYTVMYVDRARDAETAINDFHAKMEATLNEMKRDGVRKILIDKTHPLNLLIIDELLLLGKILSRGAADTPIGEILSIGRAAGYIIIANSQLGQVDTIGRIRDLFPQRVCMAVKSADLTNAVLGPHAESRGARCTEITEKGVGYIYTDRMGSFQRFKPPYVADTGLVARGGVYVPMRVRKR